MSDPAVTPARQRPTNQAGAGGAVYGLGLIGALVYFWQQADSVGDHLIAVLKALVWPALLVHGAFTRMHDR